ncbi:MAG TPA: hypothetical protein PK750_06005 [Syntrophales bacterium]|jgi:hypothetical protein|nr:hypothetical protein [Syntrophales bacterium]
MSTDMPSDKPKILFVIDRELLERLRDYRFENRINSMSEAIRQLLEIGLAAAAKKAARTSPGRDGPQVRRRSTAVRQAAEDRRE